MLLRLIFGILIISEFVFAQNILSLDDLIKLGLENNIGIKIVKNSSEILENNASIGNANLLPKIDLTSVANYNDLTMKTSAGDTKQKSSTTNAGIELNYTLFDGFSNIYTYNKLKLLSKTGNLQVKSVIENTILQIVYGYYNIGVIQENYEILKEALQISRERLSRIKAKAELGGSNKIELLSAEVDFNNDNLNVINTKRLLEETIRNLNAVVNIELEKEYLVDSTIVFGNFYNEDEIFKKANTSNTSLQLVNAGYESSEFDLSISKSSYYPRLSVKTGYNYFKPKNDFNFNLNQPNNQFSTNLVLSLNIFDGFKNSLKIQNSEIELKNNQLKIDQEKINLRKNIINTFNSFNHNLFVLKTEKNNLYSAKLNFQRAKELLEYGQITSTRFREAQLNLVRAKSNIAKAKYQAKISEFELLKLSGDLIK